MSSNGKHHPPDLLEAYLDGMLQGSRLSEFEARLLNDSSLRMEVELQRRIDETLKSRFRVMPFPELVLDRALRASEAEIEPRVQESLLTRPISIPRRWLAVAAIILLALCAYPLSRFFRAPPGQDPRAMDAVFFSQVADGFNAGWKVDPASAEFAAILQKRLGRGMQLRQPLPENVQIVGFSVAETRLSKNTVLLLARYGDLEIIVFIDRLNNDGEEQLTHGCGLSRYRREIGPFVLYEVSRLESPQLLNLFELQE